MPEISGPDLPALENHSPGNEVLFMSGFPDNALAPERLLDQGVSFLQKPFSVEG